MGAASSSTGRRENISHEITQVDVFIHHRGPGVKRTLASSIDHFLARLGVKVFLDREEREWDALLPKQIEDVMRSARIHIAIFSKDYARSPYCLEELSFMLEIEHAIIPRTIIPVFYHVEPSDLRVEVTRGLFADAFSKYETKGRYKSETLKNWKQALHNVSFRNGYVFKSNSDEGNLLGRIVDRVRQEIRNVKVPLKVAPYPCLAFPFDSMAAASSSTGRRQNDFDEIAQVASPPTTLKEPYDVFINHRGPDVKRKLAGSIYCVLDRLGVKAFLDQKELDLGDLVPKAIEDAMRSARIHIAIFSRNYATSPWCLAELSFMIEIGATIIPVFYHVEPADLRWEVTRGLYADAFSKYERDGRYRPERLEKWKQALHKVSFHTGYEFKSDSDEGDLLGRIVDRVQQEINNVEVPLDLATHPVGLDDAVREFENAIGFATVHLSTKIVGVVGMGGLGKTTLATEFYNRKFKYFEECSFLSGVRDAALPKLQEKLLQDLLHRKDIPITDAKQGKSILASRLRAPARRMLIVLDDVDREDQLDALLPDKGTNLGSGSLIIVTTRDSDVLTKWDISTVYPMKALQRRHEKELFCWYAFKEVSPPAAFEGLVQEFINACHGLPLSLKVIAGMLYLKSEGYWKSKLQNISGSLPEEINKRLRLSYDALEEREKDMFLDVACFFVGEKKNLAIAVWDAAEWGGLQGLENLENKSLVKVDKQNRIRMHSHLRDLGRKIAFDCSPYRLWENEQIMRYTKPRMLIRGIMAATTQFVACRAHDEFPKCRAHYPPPSEKCMDLRFLELLVVAGNDFTSDFAHLSLDPVWLRWFDFQHRNLPSWLSLKKLRVLELYGTSRFQQLWENNPQPPKELREMIITATEGNIFHSFPSNVSGLENLTKIALISYKGKEFQFTELPDEFCDLKSLEYLELRYCTALSSLPDRFGDLRELRHLDLCSCKELQKLPVSFQQLTKLKYLDLCGCKGLGLQEDILKNITQLENLYLSGHLKLQTLPHRIATDQPCLRELKLEDSYLDALPSNIGQLSKLEALTIGSPYLRELPDSLGDLSSLKRLSIISCGLLKSLPKTLGHLVLLEHLCIEDTKVSSLPEGFRQLANLQTLKISDCPLTELNFGSMSSFTLDKLTVIDLSITYVIKISISGHCCTRLDTLRLSKNDVLEEIETLPATVNNIELSECRALKIMNGIRALPIRPKLTISVCPQLPSEF